MESATIGVQDMVKELIAVCRDGEQGFAAAADAMSGRELKEELRSYGIERASFAEALTDALEELGFEPPAHGTAVGKVRNEWIKLIRDRGYNEHAVMAACERGEDAAREAYAAAMGAPAPERIAELISDHYPILEATRERIRELRETAEYY